MMTPNKLHTLVMQIRALATDEKFLILRDNKTPEWKNQLLRHLSDDVVYKHLRCLHPFQFFGSNANAGVYEFKANLYADHIYLKVNVKTFEVISFHYDELPFDEVGRASIARNIDIADDLQIIAERGAQGYQASFAIGSSVLTYPVDPIFQNGITTIDADQYLEAIKQMGRGVQRQVLRRIEGLSDEAVKALLGPTQDYGILSYSKGQLQLVSLCYDLWRKHPEERWLQDIAIDILLRQPADVIKSFSNQLHLSMPVLPEVSEEAKLTEETSEFSDETQKD